MIHPLNMRFHVSYVLLEPFIFSSKSRCHDSLDDTFLNICLVSFHLLLSKFNISELRPQLIHWSSIVSRGGTSQFVSCFLPAQVRMWNDLPYTVFDTVMFDGFNEAVNRWLLPKVAVFFSFPWHRCLWGCESSL